MTEYWVDHVCHAAYADVPSEDVVGHVFRGDSSLIWAIDGASPLTEEAFTVFRAESNAGWFARRLSECLKSEFADRAFSPTRLAGIIKTLRNEFTQSAGSGDADWSWPVAAAVMVEISELNDRVQMEVYRYSDCFFSVAQGGLGADVTRGRAIAMPIQTVRWKPASGFSGARLEALRERRAQQQRNVETTALTLSSESAMSASKALLFGRRPMHLLIGSDGLARLWEVYGAMTESCAMSVVAKSGVAGLIAELRRIERGVCAVPPDGKPADDACGVHVFLPARCMDAPSP